MTEKNSRIKNLIIAHGWLGILMSSFLFLIFWAGAISLFKGEIQRWAELPHHPVNQNVADKPLFEVIDEKLKMYNLHSHDGLRIAMPNAQYPYYQFFIEQEKESGEGALNDASRVSIYVNPKTGETVGDTDRFGMAGFIYLLHRNLNLSTIGTYFVGVVTLFFLFAIFSGIFIHAKKISKQFFAYRIGRKRTQLLDFHNIVGVISFPFMLMFALSGLVLNLIIIYQVSFLFLMYQGDQKAMLSDAGYDRYEIGPQTGNTIDMSAAASLIDAAKSDHGPVRFISFFNYGDDTAVVGVQGYALEKLAHNYEIYYRVIDGSIVRQLGIEETNVFRKGIDVVVSLHFGDFAGLDLRMLYFFLSMAVAGMIVVGNLLWIDKRTLQNRGSLRVTDSVSKLTIGSCAGFVVATATVFLAERGLSASFEYRNDFTMYIYWSIFVMVTLSAFTTKAIKRFINRILLTTGLVLITTIALDWWMFSKEILRLWKNGSYVVVGVELGLLLFAITCFVLYLKTKPVENPVEDTVRLWQPG